MNVECIGFKSEFSQSEIDAFAKANDLTVTYCPWHPVPEYRMFRTGTLLSRNDEYPCGLVIVDENMKARPFAP